MSTKSLNFKTVGTDTVKTLSFTIKNSGTLTLNGYVNAAELAAPLSMTAGAGSFSLTHNHTWTVKVEASPTQPGAFAGAVAITSSDPKHPAASVSVSGTAAAGLIKTPSTLSFGSLTIGHIATKRFKVSNQGPGVLHGSVGTLAAPFSVTAGSGSFVLSQGHSVSVTVQFVPTATTAASAMLAISNDDPPNGIAMVAVRGAGK
jgi:hypothetical protein